MADDLNDPERSYRRGYTHGAWDVMQAVSTVIPAAEYEKVKAWFNGPVRKWRMDADTGKNKRDEGELLTKEQAPPRHLLP